MTDSWVSVETVRAGLGDLHAASSRSKREAHAALSRMETVLDAALAEIGGEEGLTGLVGVIESIYPDVNPRLMERPLYTLAAALRECGPLLNRPTATASGTDNREENNR